MAPWCKANKAGTCNRIAATLEIEPSLLKFEISIRRMPNVENFYRSVVIARANLQIRFFKEDPLITN